MGLLTRRPDPEVEAARQLEIHNAIERQRVERQQADKAAVQHAQWLRRAAYEDAEADREAKRLAEVERVARIDQERRERQREQAQALDRQRMAELTEARGDVQAIESAIRELRVQPADLSTAAGVMAAGERETKIAGLQAALQRAQSRLVQAERACGIHRSGGF